MQQRDSLSYTVGVAAILCVVCSLAVSAAAVVLKPYQEANEKKDAALEETTRCFSCGNCFGCERCWMYCQTNVFKKIPNPTQGHYYKIDLSTCDGCKKCGPECPCGFLDMV